MHGIVTNFAGRSGTFLTSSSAKTLFCAITPDMSYPQREKYNARAAKHYIIADADNINKSFIDFLLCIHTGPVYNFVNIKL